MDAGGLAAGSHMRGELHVVRGRDAEAARSGADVRTCRVCGDEVGAREDGQPFVACAECGFPVCRPCYEYERSDGTQRCPQCNTRYKRQKGCPRVEGDEDDGPEMDDLEEEFPAAKSPGKKPHEPVAFDVYSENGEQPPQRWRTGGQTLSSFTGSVAGKDLEAEREMEAGSMEWKDRIDKWKTKQEKRGKLNHDDSDDDDEKNDDEYMLLAEARQPLWRKVPIPSSQINPYRIVIVLRLVVLCFFLKFRITTPATDAVPLWLASVVCELWFALSWILDQLPKWAPVTRETYLDRLALRYDREGEACRLAPIDFFVSTVDPLKEPPLITANTVLSILAVDYPVDRASCYVSDDGASMLLFDTLSETAEFARRWVPFCKKFGVEPRAPEFYFSQKMDYLKDKVQPTFVKERRAMKREYEEFKVRVNALVAKAQKKPEEGWVMQDGTPWPGNNTRDHPGMIQVYLGSQGALDVEGRELPRLVYVSREKRPGYNHHKKAGAMNALVRVSAVLTNAPFILNLDCDHYVNNSKAVREAMCFLMDPQLGRKLCYVQFPQRFDGIDRHDRYANRNVVFFDINMKGLDGIQGPVYVGTGCVFNRQALYGYDPPRPEKRPKMTCDCWPSWCCCCCCFGGGSKHQRRGKNKGGGADSGADEPRRGLLGFYRKRGGKKDKLGAKKGGAGLYSKKHQQRAAFELEEIEEGLEGYEELDRSSLMSQKALRLHQHHRLPLHLHPAPRLLHHPRRLPPHRQVHHPHAEQPGQHLVHRAVPVHHRDGRAGAEVERGEHRGLVAERAVLGHRRRLGAPLRRVPGPAQGAGRRGHQLHRHLQGGRRRDGRLRRALPLQVDHPAGAPHHAHHHQHGRHRRRRLRRRQQRLRLLGPALRQALLLLLGHRPPLPLPQGAHGEAEPDAHHRRALVHPPRLHLLARLG
ncbi:hypothetical protein PVAP13_9KG193600 [Panicum virgatum]|uniref:Cellulose synthase n=1 Tax=Panicum virgatum TaxID=38727 RepID=A0A8T0NGQ1_PANVG|nr:hypothetical protein PVAP13_9KG193600 [Panicum virgatum]